MACSDIQQFLAENNFKKGVEIEIQKLFKALALEKIIFLFKGAVLNIVLEILLALSKAIYKILFTCQGCK